MTSAYGMSVSRAQELAIAGTPPQVADQLGRYIEAGAERIALISDSAPPSESWPLVGEVRHLLRGRSD